MIKVETKTGYILFANQEDADNYKDYLKNGLKVIRKSPGQWIFNDGSKLFDVSMKNSSIKKYVLHKGNKNTTSERFLKKYVALINQKKG